MDKSSFLVEKIKQRFNAFDFEELYNLNIGLCITYCEKYLGKNVFYDVRDVCTRVLYESIYKYDKERGVKFSTFFCHQICYFCLQEKRKIRRNNNFLEKELDFYAENHTLGYDDLKKEDEKQQRIVKVGNLLNLENPQTQTLVKLKYHEGLKLKDVAKRMNVSPQRCSKIHKDFIKKIQEGIK